MLFESAGSNLRTIMKKDFIIETMSTMRTQNFDSLILLSHHHNPHPIITSKWTQSGVVLPPYINIVQAQIIGNIEILM
jgi:peptidase E